MPTVYKTAADRGKKSVRWMVAWTDEFGRRRTRRAYTDKALSERMARQLEDEARARRDGTIDMVVERMGAHARAPLEDHLADYERAMEAKGNTPGHTKQAMKNIRFAAESGTWKTIADIDHASLDLAIDRLRAKKRSHATINHRIRSAKSFTRWLLSNHRLARDPLVGVKMLNVASDRRRERRALDDDELAALLRIAADIPSVTVEHRYIRKSGPNKGKLRLGTRTFTIERRDLLYLLAASTGLRFSEIKSLTPASFDFASDPKTVTVEASYSKRRRRDVQPIREDIAETMRPFVEAAPKRKPLWPKLPDEIARVMAQDLEAAKIPVTDDAGRVIDFHALRHTFITRLARSGVTPKVAQALARHSTITLTMDRYAHVALADTSKALASLPALPTRDEPQREALAATGTHGREDAGEGGQPPSCGRGRDTGQRRAERGLVRGAAARRIGRRTRLRIAAQIAARRGQSGSFHAIARRQRPAPKTTYGDPFGSPQLSH